MITFRYIPNILKNEGRIVKELPFSPVKPLSDYLSELELDFVGWRIIVNGKLITDYAIWLENEDEVIITPAIEDLTFLFNPAFWAAVWTVTQVVTTVVAIGYAIYSAFQKPRTPNLGNGEGLDEGSPTYGWDGIVNTSNVGIPIGIVYGEHRVGGNIINQYIRTDGDKQYINMLIALSEGEIESIDDIEINENPSANFADISLTKRYGTNDQTQISNFNDSHDLKPLNVQLVKHNLVDGYVHTTVNTDITAFELRLTCQGGLFAQGDDGAIANWTVTYNVEYKIHTDPAYTDLGETVINGRSRTDLYRVFRKDGLTAGQYDIRVTRVSDDSTLTPIQQGDLFLKGVDEIAQDEPLVYPGVALIGVEALATDQLSGGAPTITSLIKGRKVRVPDIREDEGGSAVLWDDYYYDDNVSLYKGLSDSRELYWDGETYINAFSANPIWCLRDLLTNTRYGLGDYITTEQISPAQLLEMAQYCEEKVSDGLDSYEKRFRLDVVIDSSVRAIDLITQLAATFRCFVFYSAGTIKLKIDKEDTPVQMFGMGNIISGNFIQSWKSLKDIPNVIEAQFMDKDLNYKQEIISVLDEDSIAAGSPLRKKSLRLFCTRTSQAIREAKYAINIAKYINRIVSLRAGIDAIACQAGDVINVSHDVPVWGVGSGRTQADCTTTLIKLDQPVTLENKIYKIRIRFADDTQEERFVSNGAGVHTEVTASSALSNAPAAFDIYSIGEVDKVVAPYRIMAIKRSGNSEVEIEALEYNAGVYNTDTIYIPDNNYSALSMDISDVQNLKLTERLVRLNDGTIENCIDVWWTKPQNPTKVITFEKIKIYLSEDNGESWKYINETYEDHFQIIGDLINNVTYKVAAVSVGFNGKSNAIKDSPQMEIVLTGKSSPPSDITTFLVNQSRDRLYFGWSPVTDTDLAGYEIRYGATWETAPSIATVLKSNNLIVLDFRTGASQSFWIKAIDTSGNYSETATEGIVTIDSIPFTNVVKTFSDQTAWAGTKSNLSKVDDNLEIDATYLTGTYVTGVKNVGYVATFKIGIEAVITLSGDSTWEDYGEETFVDIPDTLRFSGVENLGAASFEIKTSDDNITWSDYSIWQAADYKCLCFQIRMTLTRESTVQDLECSELNCYADLPDVDEFDDGEVTVASTGLAVTFTKTYHEIPSVNIDILSGDGYVHKFSSAPSITGFTVKLYKLDGTAVTGTFRYHSHGI